MIVAGMSVGGLPRSSRGFTLTEVVVSLAISATAFAGIIYGYSSTTDQAEWSGLSLAAQSLAMQGVEQARAAKWDPRAYPPIDEMPAVSSVAVEELDVPAPGGKSLLATNYLTITQVTDDPPLRELRADCVWSLPYRSGKIRGPFTNTSVTLRAPDQ
jgi:prepilin-type N-terminal cleavage/methylation domain-containing protein